MQAQQWIDKPIPKQLPHGSKRSEAEKHATKAMVLTAVSTSIT